VGPRILSIGHVCLDMVYLVDQLPTTDAKVDSTKADLRIGGNAANVAHALTKIGVNVELHSIIGSRSDTITMILTRLISDQGIRYKFDHVEQASSPMSSIMVLPDGSRTIVNHTDSALTTASSITDGIMWYDLIMGDTHRLNLVKDWFNAARATGKATMLDVDKPVSDISELPHADFIWFSQESWVSMGLFKLGLQKVGELIGSTVGVTDGGNPIRWVERDGIVRFYEPPQVVPVNTLGAGDAWRAGLATCLMKGMTLESSITRACQTASEHIMDLPLTEITGE
jgi:sugar/nucleoside kinase (ribokinase family)